MYNCGVRYEYCSKRISWETYRSVTMSKTAPNFEVCFSALAACPSAASSRQEIPYASVQYFGWKLIKCNATPARMIREYPIQEKHSMSKNVGEGYNSFLPIRLGTKRKTFSEYVWAVARSTATLASTTSIEPLRRRWTAEPLDMLWGL